MTRGRSRGEAGATAVLVALLSVVLFSMAAIAVDLGNAWARKRTVQKQVDISALSAGFRLPQTSANKALIAAEVATYLNDNLTSGQATVTGANLLDGTSSNGEVTFFDNAGLACAESCTQMTVLAPVARVDFGFAGIMGFSHTDVQRTAQVRVVSALPPKQKMIPLWLPSGCGLGPAQSDTSGGGGPAPAPPTTSTAPTTSAATGTGSPSGTGTASPSGTGIPVPVPTVTVTATPTFAPAGDPGTHVLSGTSPLAVAANSTTTVSGYTVIAVPSNTDRASIRFYSPDGLRFVEYAVTESQPKGTLFVPPFSVGTEVTATPGDWRVYAMIQPNGANKTPEYSATSLIFRVGGAAPTTPAVSTTGAPTDASASPSSVPVGCVGQDRGNFGQLDSPRKDSSNHQTRLALNMAEGLDHQLVPYVFASSADTTKDCGKVGNAIPGAQLDSTPIDGRNCIQGDTGNDGPALYDGLVSGLLGKKGRLDVSRGATSCPANPSRANTSIGSTTINNDVLSCFLTNGATLTSITQATGVDPSMLDPAIVDSPRFVWLPVVYANDRAQKNFQPILEFVPAFITDETQTTPATGQNGLQINGNSVKILQTFTFNKDALPIDEQSPTVDYDPVVGGSIVRLIG